MSKTYKYLLNLSQVYITKSKDPIHAKPEQFFVPIAQWGLALTVLSDITRPIQQVSKSQTFALTVLGIVFSAKSLISRPIKIIKFTPAFLIAAVSSCQLNKIFKVFKMIILSGVYRSLITTGEKVIPPAVKRIIKWDHPAGPKTIHFWAPFMKWSLVAAGIGDMARPAEKLSKNQTISLLCTGAIWSRYSMVIKPKNYTLFLVNAFLACVATVQLTRIYFYEQSLAKKEEQKAIKEN